MKDFNQLSKIGVKMTAIACAVFIHAVLAQAVTAQDQLAPANDNFAAAQVLSTAVTSVNGTTAAATNEPGEPGHGDNRGGSSVWYKYVAPGTGVLHVNTAGTGLDTTLAVYTGTNLSDLVLHSENDNMAENLAFSNSSSLKTGVVNGTTYYIAVDGKN
ncbi:MAG TPA: hypothetical protein VJL58_06110, partial [Pyrinomonadaceae bacterium]|nr:hypothetical protein [Pyrinomonadaceae bacterium]